MCYILFRSILLFCMHCVWMECCYALFGLVDSTTITLLDVSLTCVSSLYFLTQFEYKLSSIWCSLATVMRIGILIQGAELHTGQLLGAHYWSWLAAMLGQFLFFLFILFYSTELNIYCHVLVTRHRVWIDNWIYWTIITRNYK
jgi:hypothetical protein